MSGRSRGKYWSTSILKRRGWTNTLIRELLPRPRHLPADGHTVRAWPKEDVLLAESSPQFTGAARTDNADIASAAETKRACALLSQSWESACKDDSAPWLLAAHYHRGILARLPLAAKGRGLRLSQTTAWLNEFLTLERRCDSKRIPDILKHFCGPEYGRETTPTTRWPLKSSRDIPMCSLKPPDRSSRILPPCSPRPIPGRWCGKRTFRSPS